MSNRLKATLIGVVFSLGAIALWVLLSYVGFIAGIAGALMGMLFIIGYRKFNPEDKSKYPIIFACVLIVIEIVISELITIAIAAGIYDVPFAMALSIDEIKRALILDIVLGLALSFLVFIIYLVGEKKKKQQGKNRIYTDTNFNNQGSDNTQLPNNDQFSNNNQFPNDNQFSDNNRFENSNMNENNNSNENNNANENKDDWHR